MKDGFSMKGGDVGAAQGTDSLAPREVAILTRLDGRHACTSWIGRQVGGGLPKLRRDLRKMEGRGLVAATLSSGGLRMWWKPTPTGEAALSAALCCAAPKPADPQDEQQNQGSGQ
jgi:hypothetical protein